MKKMIYIFALSIGVGLLQSVGAFSTCCYETRRKNGVVRMARGREVIYKRINPVSGMTTRVGNRNGVYTGSSYRWALLTCTHKALTRQEARLIFFMLHEYS